MTVLWNELYHMLAWTGEKNQSQVEASWSNWS